MTDGNEVMVVGSVALDTVITPFGEAKDMLGGSAVYFSLAASIYAPVRFVGVVGDDFPPSALEILESRGVDLAGLQHMTGRTFRWGGRYGYDFIYHPRRITQPMIRKTTQRPGERSQAFDLDQWRMVTLAVELF